MLLIPARTNLSALERATASIGPAAAFGVCRRIDHERAALLNWYALGVSDWVLPVDALPEALRFGGDPGTRQSDIDSLGTPPLEQFLRDNRAGWMASAPVADDEPGTRFYLASREATPFSRDQLAVLSAAAA